MKCPLLTAGDFAYAGAPSVKEYDCLESDCGMYDGAGEGCAVLEISRVLTAIGGTLGTIVQCLRRDIIEYRCFQCGTVMSILPEDIETPESGWTRAERVDGTHAWLCRHCSEGK